MHGVHCNLYRPRCGGIYGKEAEEVKKYFSGQVFHTLIPRNVRLGEAPSHGEPITIYDSHSRGADVYRKLAREVIRRVG